MAKRTKDYRKGLLKSLTDPHEAAYYLDAAIEESTDLFLVALRDVAEARQVSKVAKDAGLARESLYRMLSVSGNPTLDSLTAILKSVGLKLSVNLIADSAVAHEPVDEIYSAPHLSALNVEIIGFLPIQCGAQIPSPKLGAMIYSRTPQFAGLGIMSASNNTNQNQYLSAVMTGHGAANAGHVEAILFAQGANSTPAHFDGRT